MRILTKQMAQLVERIRACRAGVDLTTNRNSKGNRGMSKELNRGLMRG